VIRGLPFRLSTSPVCLNTPLHNHTHSLQSPCKWRRRLRPCNAGGSAPTPRHCPAIPIRSENWRLLVCLANDGDPMAVEKVGIGTVAPEKLTDGVQFKEGANTQQLSLLDRITEIRSVPAILFKTRGPGMITAPEASLRKRRDRAAQKGVAHPEFGHSMLFPKSRSAPTACRRRCSVIQPASVSESQPPVQKSQHTILGRNGRHSTLLALKRTRQLIWQIATGLLAKQLRQPLMVSGLPGGADDLF
jgi:hypothetical protein